MTFLLPNFGRRLTKTILLIRFTSLNCVLQCAGHDNCPFPLITLSIIINIPNCNTVAPLPNSWLRHCRFSLFEQTPELLPMFSDVQSDDQSSAAFRAHAGRVLSGIDRLISVADLTPTLLADAKHLQEQHAERGITAENFQVGEHSSSATRGAGVALTVRSVPRRIVPKLHHFHWLLKMNIKLTLSYVGPILPLVQRPSGDRVTNKVGTIFRKNFVGTRARPI